MSEHLGEMVLAFVANELDADGRSAATRHLEQCAECRDEVRRVQLAHSALAGWPRQPELPPALELSLLAAHADRIGAPEARAARVPRAALLRTAATVLLALVCGVVGYRLGLGRALRAEPAEVASMPLFMLLLEERAWPDPSRPRSGYMEWGQSLRAANRLDRAEKLTDEPGWRIDSDGQVSRPGVGARPPNVSGWFLVRAENYEAAIELARQGPHLRWGSVLVRQIE